MYRFTVTIGTPNVSTISFGFTVPVLTVLGFYRNPIVNLSHSSWKHRQLHLWHAFSYQPLATGATIFRLILISSIPGKSPVRSGGLTVSPYNRTRTQVDMR